MVSLMYGYCGEERIRFRIKTITNLVMSLQENYLIMGSSYFLTRISC